MRGGLTRQINVRLEQTTIDQINQLIAEGEFYSMAEFLRYACNQVLKKYEGRSPPPLAVTDVPREAGAVSNLTHLWRDTEKGRYRGEVIREIA